MTGQDAAAVLIEGMDKYYGPFHALRNINLRARPQRR